MIKHPVWSELVDYLNQQYQIVGNIDLLNSATDPHDLYQAVGALARSKFEDCERIMVTHYDTDFYIKNYGIGVQNFLTCLHHFDISPSKVIFLTNHPGIKDEIDQFYQEKMQLDDFLNDRMTVIVNNYSYLQTTPTPVERSIDIHRIKYHYMCLCGAQRAHRALFLCLLKDLDILSKGLVSWHFNSSIPTVPTETVDKTVKQLNVPLITVVPKTRINEWSLKSALHKKCWETHHAYFEKDFKDPKIEGVPNHANNRFDIASILECFLYISVETTFDYPHAYLTEKTFRCIMHKRPFIIVGAPNSLRRLQDLGFKTFDHWWNESYDKETDPTNRMDCILNIVQSIASQHVDQLQSMCYNMIDVLEYNYRHYVENYCNIRLENLINQV